MRIRQRPGVSLFSSYHHNAGAMSSIVADTPPVVDDDAPGPPISVPDSGEGEGGKLKMIVQLVKKSLGVKDIAAMCVLSLLLARKPPLKSFLDELGAFHCPRHCSSQCRISRYLSRCPRSY
jgi:hypothetical protein